MIQKILHEIIAQCTVLIVSHRLNTSIGLDRIMIGHWSIVQDIKGICFAGHDGGEIVEMDDPFELLRNDNSQLQQMVDRQGPQIRSAQLYKMAEAAQLIRKKGTLSKLKNMSVLKFLY